MPISRLTCPHCEQEVEINVTDVTRSRDCPRCGRYIILQFTTKATRMKRKALLTPTVQVGEPLAAVTRATVVARPQGASVVTGRDAPGSTSTTMPRPVAARAAGAAPFPAAAPVVAQTYEGSPGERVQYDPDIKRKSGTLLWGVGVVLGLIALVVAADRFQWWSAMGDSFSRMMTYLSPPKPEIVGTNNNVAVDPNLPSAREVLGPSEPAVEMKLPDEIDISGDPGKGAMSEQEKAMRAVKTYLEAPTLKERLKLVRDQQLVVDKMVKYYETNSPGPIPYQKIVARETSPAGVLSFAFNVVLPSGDERRIVVARSLNGQYLVDWASFVLYGDMTWQQFLESKPASPTMLRVLAEPTDHFNEAFPQDGGYVALKLTDPASKNSPPIYAYATKGTPLGMALEFIARKSSGQAQPVMLTLKFPENVPNADGDQVWVEELVAEGWLARGR
jgi:hypothetical protein